VPGKDREEETGKYTTSYADTDFLQAIEQLDGMAGTSDIAEKVGCSQRTAYTRLQSLEEDDQVKSQTIGNSIIWTID
jgi:DNA-binding MarR family transcriptional regulator